MWIDDNWVAQKRAANMPLRWYDDVLHYPATFVDGWVAIDERDLYRNMNIERRQYWLIENNEAVAYAEVMVKFDYPEAQQLVLCDIEVRPDKRGNGLVRKLVAEVEKYEGRTLYTTGHFTPAGSQSLGFLPVLSWETAGVWFSDQKFVIDWDEMLSCNP